ncbi:MAG: phenylacetate-CoA oxygenase subunit PaaC [Bacteroidetes bacterium]|nr:phenylacetate-CoA oxygenase subunit PaaC [Bacteroidota bacterium]
MTQTEALYHYTLRLGDNSLISGHRLSEWCSRGPILEEDLALTNMALDHIGRAQAFLKYAGELSEKKQTEDDLAYKRGERQFLNNLITELPNQDFAFTIARQLIISCFEFYLYTELCNSNDPIVAGISEKAVKEVKYHLAHATDWTCRLGDGTELSHQKMQKALNDIWMFTGELFEMDETDQVLLKAGIAADMTLIKPLWYNHLKQVTTEAGLKLPEDAYMQSGSRKGIHTEYLGHILSEMQYLQRAYPTAQW